MSTNNDIPKRPPAYSPPVHASHLDAKYPYYYGYHLMKRDDRWEIWHYASDRLVRVEPTLDAAMGWVHQNRAIPRSVTDPYRYWKTWAKLGHS